MSEGEAAATLTCQELVELVTDYLEGSLPSAERARFDEHIAGCTGCTNYLRQMRRTIQTVGYLSEDHVSPEAERELLDAFRTWKDDRQIG